MGGKTLSEVLEERNAALEIINNAKDYLGVTNLDSLPELMRGLSLDEILINLTDLEQNFSIPQNSLEFELSQANKTNSVSDESESEIESIDSESGSQDETAEQLDNTRKLLSLAETKFNNAQAYSSRLNEKLDQILLKNKTMQVQISYLSKQLEETQKENEKQY